MKISKLKCFFLLATFACGAAQAEDDNVFYFTDAAILRGETETIELCMRNTSTDLTCIEAEIQLPEGLSVVCDDEGNPVATLYRNRTASHDFLVNVLGNGNFKLLVSSANGALIKGTEGPLLAFTVRADEDAPIGEYTMETVGESLFVSAAAKAYYSVGATGSVLITDDPTSINKGLRIKNEESDAAIYDLSGRRIGSSLKKGIFIKDGKKELHK